MRSPRLAGAFVRHMQGQAHTPWSDSGLAPVNGHPAGKISQLTLQPGDESPSRTALTAAWVRLGASNFWRIFWT
jgi:hypothetical protein